MLVYSSSGGCGWLCWWLMVIVSVMVLVVPVVLMMSLKTAGGAKARALDVGGVGVGGCGDSGVVVLAV